MYLFIYLLTCLTGLWVTSKEDLAHYARTIISILRFGWYWLYDQAPMAINAPQSTESSRSLKYITMNPTDLLLVIPHEPELAKL